MSLHNDTIRHRCPPLLWFAIRTRAAFVGGNSWPYLQRTSSIPISRSDSSLEVNLPKHEGS